MTKETSKYFPPQTKSTARLRARVIAIDIETIDGPDAMAQLRAGLERAGIVSSDPNTKRAKPAGSSPALRIACRVCSAPAGSYCLKNGRNEVQVIAHKRRREEEERTR